MANNQAQKKKTTAATVAYVLDPDLAVPDIMDRSLASTFGMKNKGAKVSFKSKKGSIKARGAYKKETKAALDLIIDEIAPFIDLLVTPSLASIDNPPNNLVIVKEEITSSEFMSLNTFGKQLYVKATDSLYDRYTVESDYAGLPIPPPGRFGKLSSMFTKDVGVKVRGQYSRNREGTRHMLVRLKDGSLLEFYTTGNTPTDSKVEAFFNKVIVQEPVVLKKFIIAPGLTNYLGRPAYNLNIVIAIDDGNAKLSTVPKTTEVIEYYDQQVAVEELIEVSDSTVLDTTSSILPATIFFVGGDSKIEDEYKKQFNRMITKYSPLTRKSKRHEIAFVALAKLNSTTTSRYFNNTAYGGGTKDMLNPIVLETILDEYIANKSRNSFIDAAIPLLAGDASASSAASLSGYCTNGGRFPAGSEMGAFFSSRVASRLGTVISKATTTTKTTVAPVGSTTSGIGSVMARSIAAVKATAEKKAEEEAAKKKAAEAAAIVKLTPAQMLEKGKQLLSKYLPDVFGEEDKSIPTTATVSQPSKIVSAISKTVSSMRVKLFR